jgi:sugar lactone lactonase YvrE
MEKSALLLFLVIAVVLFTCREIDSVTPNLPPQALAGANASVAVGETVNLDASESFDPEDDQLSYSWQFISKPTESTISIGHFDSIKASFIADKAGQYKIKLLVSDNTYSASDTVEIAVQIANVSPTVNAGSDAQVDLGTQYTLKGTATDPDGDQLTTNWTLLSKPVGSTATVQNPTNFNALFVPDKHGTYTARLQVSDGTFTVTDDLVITTAQVSITSISPISGIRGTTVKIIGKNFSATASENAVSFNGVNAIISSASYTAIDALVPLAAGTGPVAVRVNNITATGSVFTYILAPVASTVTQFTTPFNLVSDNNGNLYISDFTTHVIRKLTTAGVLTTFAGTGQAGYANGKVADAQFNKPAGIAIDSKNENIFVVDNGNHCIRVISLASGTVATYAGFPQAGYSDGLASIAQFNGPIGLAIDGTGNLYVGDTGNSRVRKISTSAVVSTLAPNNPVFTGIAGVVVDGNGTVYAAEALNHRIQKISPTGAVSTLAGSTTSGFINATGTAARFNVPYSISIDATGNIFVADFSNHSIRKITPQGVTTTLLGTGTPGFVEGANAQFNQPIGITVRTNGDIYVADFGNMRVRRITFE